MLVVRCAPNACGEVLLGMKTVREVVYTSVLKFLVRLRSQPEDRWSKDALKAHLYQNWKSPYLAYISRIRTETGVTRSLLSPRHVEVMMAKHFRGVLNTKISAMRLPGMGKVDKLTQATHINETEASQVTDEYMDNWVLKLELSKE